MNARKLIRLAAALAAVSAAAVVCVVAASFALYAFVRDWIGPAPAAAVVSGTYAAFAVIVAWLATRKAVPKAKPGVVDEATMTDRLVGMAKERPLIALGVAAAGAAAAVTVMVRNPALVTALVSAFVAGGSRPKSDR